MWEELKGLFAIAMAGHDKGQIFIIIKEEGEYVYLVDGRLRTLEHPKKKKKKHISLIHYKDEELLYKQESSCRLTNEDIKYALKRYRKNCSD